LTIEVIVSFSFGDIIVQKHASEEIIQIGRATNVNIATPNTYISSQFLMWRNTNKYVNEDHKRLDDWNLYLKLLLEFGELYISEVNQLINKGKGKEAWLKTKKRCSHIAQSWCLKITTIIEKKSRNFYCT